MYNALLKKFITSEVCLVAAGPHTRQQCVLIFDVLVPPLLISKKVMPWREVEEEFGPTLRALSLFDITDKGKARWDDLRNRVVEHVCPLLLQLLHFVWFSPPPADIIKTPQSSLPQTEHLRDGEVLHAH